MLKEKGRVCYFHPKCEYEPKYYNEYHQEIAGYIAEFGERILEAVNYVVEGEITRRDLGRIIAVRRLIDKLDGVGLDFFTHISAFIENAHYPFNRNKLSAENFSALTSHIADMMAVPAQSVAEDIAQKVVILGKKDAKGLMCLDVPELTNNIDVIEEVKALADAKAASKKEQNRKANRKYKQTKKQGAGRQTKKGQLCAAGV